MLFHTLPFLVLFLIVHPLFLVLPKPWKIRLLLVASYVFYGWWDYRFLGLLFLTTLLDYYCGKRLASTEDPRRRKMWLLFSVVGNLTVLGFFKYYNFFVDSAVEAAARLGVTLHPPLLNVILPVGISFYTFQEMTYVIDIYRRELAPAKSLAIFALFVTYFPQLVAGPIERAKHLLGQLETLRKVVPEDYRVGIRLFLIGMFLKVVVADNLSVIADRAFTLSGEQSGAYLLLGVLAFGFQIYGDFCGYSTMARGISRVFGVELMLNFRAPYFALDPSDFWRRWHISLSTWLRDYLYIPLGGRSPRGLITYRNLAITMLLGGLWHGARWNFVLWGAFHGGILILYHALGLPKRRPRSLGGKALAMLVMFILVHIGWILFRVRDLAQVSVIFDRMLHHFDWGADETRVLGLLLLLITPVVALDALEEKRPDPFASPSWRLATDLGLAAFVVFTVATLGFTRRSFIYFQF